MIHHELRRRPYALPRLAPAHRAALDKSAPKVQRATLGGTPGSAVLRSRWRDSASRLWRGTFVFGPEHEPAMEKLADGTGHAVFEGIIEGARRRLDVTVTALAVGTGLVFFEGAGEPY